MLKQEPAVTAHQANQEGRVPTAVKLIIAKGHTSQDEFDVVLPVVIGRTAELQIAHDSISRRHCELFGRNGYVWVRDMGSSNGTFTNGSRVEEAIVRPGDRLTVGPLTFIVTYEAGKVTTTRPASVAAVPAGSDVRSTAPLPDQQAHGHVDGEATIHTTKEELELEDLIELAMPSAKQPPTPQDTEEDQQRAAAQARVDELRELRKQTLEHCQATIATAQVVSRKVDQVIEQYGPGN